MTTKTRHFLSITTLLLLSTVVVVAADTTDEEWIKYGCGTDQEVGMAACFCGFLRDRMDDEAFASQLLSSSQQESAALMQAQGSAVSCSNGKAAGYPCSNVDLLAHLPLSTFSSSEANDVWGWTHAGTGREFAIICLRDGTGFVEITDPVNPIYLGKLPTHTSSSMWRDVKTYKDHAFIVSEANNHGMQVFDLTKLLSVQNTPLQFSATAFYNQNVRGAHNIVINEESGYAYIVGSNRCNGGLHFVDIEDPSNPKDAGCFDDDGYTHDAHCVIYNGPDSAYVGREICFACNEDTVTVVDVTNKNSPVQLNRISYSQEGKRVVRKW
jgi:choice-of-anchor B domain-containing protein